ncbi:MAG: tryptophan synthase subunit alpha [Rhodospirillales bacterium]|nr:tryptophan synthase subunit alpha [Rhodospirillales bacterium]
MKTENRIARRFAALRREGRGGLVTFITAGDPDADTSMRILGGLPAAGADFIELGMPFSDPMADGPAIQAASQRALKAGQTIVKTLAMVSDFRRQDRDTPLILMGYYNPIYVYGPERFIADAKAAGVDGLIIVDLPPEEDEELRRPAKAAGIDIILLVAPTTGDDRLPIVLGHASGFVYYVSITGITGTASATATDIGAALARIRQHTRLPVAVGFGIKTRDQTAEIGAIADAAVVGSALVNQIADTLTDSGAATATTVTAALSFVRDLAEGLRSPPATQTPSSTEVLS